VSVATWYEVETSYTAIYTAERLSRHHAPHTQRTHCRGTTVGETRMGERRGKGDAEKGRGRLREETRVARVARFFTTKYVRFFVRQSIQVQSAQCVDIYNSVHVATRTQIPHKQ